MYHCNLKTKFELQLKLLRDSNEHCVEEVQDFVTTCSASTTYPNIKGFQSNQQDTLALCCKDNVCCQKLESILGLDCIKNCELNVSQAISEAIGAQHTICQSNQIMPQCLLRVDANYESIVKRCAQRSLDVINACGFVSEDEHGIPDKYSCCFPQSCCKKSRDYLNSECNNACFERESQSFSVIHMASSIAKTWQNACLLSPATQECSVQQVMSTTSSYNSAQIPFYEPSQGVAVSEVSSDDFEVYSNMEPSKTVLDECDTLYEKLQSESVQGASQNLQTYCATPDDVSILSLQNLCCELVDTMVWDACKYSSCSTNSIIPYDQSSLQILTSWIDSTKCPISISQYQQCDIKRVLTNISGCGTDTSTDSRVQTSPLAQILPGNNQFDVDSVMVLLGMDDKTDVERQQAGFELFQSVGLNKNMSHFQLLQIMPKFTKFYEQMNNLGVEQSLKGIPLTILAIDNDNIEKMQKQWKGADTTQIMRNHIVLGPFLSDRINPGEQVDLQTLAADTITIKSSLHGQVIVEGCCSSQNSAKHVADVQTQDGTLWIVDNFIYPQSLAPKLAP